MTDTITDSTHEDHADASSAPATDADEVLYCTVHPDRDTMLRCNKCGRPMCIKCAVKTPVGYRCRECVRGQQDVFFSASTADYVIAGSVSVFLGIVAINLAGMLPFLFMILLAPVVGGIIPGAVMRLTGRRRGRYTGHIVAAGILVGMTPTIWPVVRLLFYGAPLGYVIQAMIWPVLFAAVTASVAFSWFRTGRAI
jgi:hypothetical protein